MTTTPHDALFKAAFESPEHASALLRPLLPPAVSAAITWESMTLQPGSFVDPKLADRHTDLLFSVQLREGGDALLYFLLEHQSTGDPDMPLRVLAYMVRIWERFRAEHEDARLPPIVPMVVSHVPGGWTAPRSFDELLDPNPASIPGLGELVPRFSLLIEDLAHLSNDDLKSRSLAAFPKVALWALRDGRHADHFGHNMGAWIAAFADVARAPNGLRALEQLIRYFALVTDPLPFEAFRARILEDLPGTEEITMSWFDHQQEQALAKGRAEGRAEGRVEGRADVLRKQLIQKFGPIDSQHTSRIEAASPETLDHYLERVLTATTLDAVFAE
ncbi:MAG: Rpn family recombination-promoting nuclease/putative transposase [Deltaproteobacteria bacterium]|nr:Rpn family recombination-promoting nuclease/putative transposase [Deltaproteobacteria bacterium]